MDDAQHLPEIVPVDGEPGPYGGRPFGEQAHRLRTVGLLDPRARRRQGERTERDECLAVDRQRLPARGRHPQLGAAGQQGRDEVGHGVDQVLAVVVHEQALPAVQLIREDVQLTSPFTSPFTGRLTCRFTSLADGRATGGPSGQATDRDADRDADRGAAQPRGGLEQRRAAQPDRGRQRGTDLGGLDDGGPGQPDRGRGHHRGDDHGLSAGTVTPERHRLAEQGRRRGRVTYICTGAGTVTSTGTDTSSSTGTETVTALGGEPLEPQHVHVGRFHSQPVAARGSCDDAGRAEGSAQPGDECL
ncbi:hypothetical protein AB0D10_32065 [Kitasatospora sp. NPDC048545]|uniref:hypothetical protein n=1 Tax=Kitasatospora sp. NPDC048545 TaxID=3157208 RepID=UPI00340465A1